MTNQSKPAEGLAHRDLDTRTTLSLFAAAMVVIIVLAVVYLYWPSATALPGESFVVPEDAAVFLSWRSRETGQMRHMPLDALPGQAVRVLIGAPEGPRRTLDDIYAAALKPEGYEQSLSPLAEAPPLMLGPGVTVLEDGLRPVGGSRFQFTFLSARSDFAQALRARERLDDVVGGAASELERFRGLMLWVRRALPEGEPNPYPPFDALEILDLTRQGRTKAFCGQYAQVLVQSLASLGYPARYVGLTSHEVLEVWSNEYVKWFVLDPYSACYYTRDSTPLSALEIHTAVCHGATEAIEWVRLDPALPRERAAQLDQYRTFNIGLITDHPLRGGSGTSHVRAMWYRRVWWLNACAEVPQGDGRLRLVTNQELDFYFNLNTVAAVFVPVAAGVLEVQLTTNMPDFARYERAQGAGDWEPVGPVWEWTLAPGENGLRLRAVNARGVVGPESHLRVNYGGDRGAALAPATSSSASSRRACGR